MSDTNVVKLDVEVERLTQIFKAGPLREWRVEDIRTSSLMRFVQAYLMMARAGYRPGAPSDGVGNIQLSREQVMDEARLYREAIEYAVEFRREEDSRSFWIGCSNYTTNRGFMLAIEAARLLAGGGDACAVKLLKLAIKEIEQNTRVNKP